MKIERLTENNVDLYLEYLKKAMSLEPNLMVAEYIDEIGIRNRVRDDFYMNTTSLLAIVDNSVVGRIEYHFYGCMQDGYRMAYVDWIYVLPEFRHQGIARHLFEEFEKDCRKNRINQFYLIRATNSNADKFYSCGGFNTRRSSATICVVTKGIKADCNHLMRTTYPDALRRGC